MKATLFDRRHRREALTGGDQPLALVRAPTWRRVCLALLQVRRHLWTNAWGRGDRRLRIPDWKKIGGWYPKLPSNGDRPVPDTGNELCAYSTHESCWLQEDGFWEATHRNTRSKSWLALSCLTILTLGMIPRRKTNSRP